MAPKTFPDRRCLITAQAMASGLFPNIAESGKVYINDIDPCFTEASQSLAARLDIRIDGFITEIPIRYVVCSPTIPRI